MPGFSIGPQSGSSQIVGSSSLPSNPTFRQIYATPAGLYICLSDGTWSLLDSADAGTVSGSGVTNRLTKWTDGTGSVLGDSGVADDGTNVLSLRPFAVGYGLSTPASLLAGPKISAASTVSTSPRGILSAQFTSDTAGARVGLQKARGTVGTPTTVVSGDTLGRVMFRGYDGTGYLEMGSVEVASTGTIATNRIPTTMVLSTATNANPSVLTTALTLGADQSAAFANAVTATSLALNGATIGTNNLAVTGTSIFSNKMTVSSAAADWAVVATNTGGAGNSYGLEVNGGTNSSDISFLVQTNGGTEYFQVRGDGQVSAKTALSGTGSRAVLADANGVLSAPVSDEAFKEPLRTLPESYGIEMVMKLRPSIFKYRDKTRFGSQDYLGFGARETAKILPEVTGQMKDGTYYLTDEKLVVVLIKAVQQQQKQIELLMPRL